MLRLQIQKSETINTILCVIFYAFMVVMVAYSIQLIVDDVQQHDYEQLKFNTAFFGIESAFVIVITWMIVSDFAVLIKNRSKSKSKKNL